MTENSVKQPKLWKDMVRARIILSFHYSHWALTMGKLWARSASDSWKPSIVGTTTYRSALWRTARHYTFCNHWCGQFVWVWSEFPVNFLDWAESHIDILYRSEKLPEIRSGSKVRDENSLGRNSCNSLYSKRSLYLFLKYLWVPHFSPKGTALTSF
jgi:hypothetical protein